MNYTHPLDNLVKDNSLFLLEAMVPFVDRSYKKPLVLYIKYRELAAIMNCLDDYPYLSACGFDCHPKSAEDMLQSMCNFLPKDYANYIKQMKQIMSMMELMNLPDTQNCTSFENENEQNNNSCSTSQNNLFDNVLSILNQQ